VINFIIIQYDKVYEKEYDKIYEKEYVKEYDKIYENTIR